MHQETELKLLVDESQLPVFKTLPFWKKFAKGEPDIFHLGNIYFDTASRDLNRMSAALRIREKNGQYFQTLKTRGESVNGLTRRGEWEWPIACAQLDMEGLQKYWPASLGEFPEAQLEAMFSTDFDRTCWHINWLKPEASLEVALDVGYVKSGDLCSRICELEIELISGDEEAIRQVAAALSREVNLKPSDISKAERGFQLLQARQPE